MSKETLILTPRDADQAGRILNAGGLVVFPTETVYGLGASAVDPTAVRNIFHAKGRPTDNPLIAHFADPGEVQRLLPSSAGDLTPLLEELMPGPLTLVVPAPTWAPPVVTGGLDSLAVRVPDHPVARQIISVAGVPVAAPSANRSGRPSPTTFAMAMHEMEGRVDAILKGPDCPVGIESTVVDVREPGVLTVLRPGRITPAEMRRFCDRDIRTGPVESHRSPGTRYRHYRPDAPVFVVPTHLWDDARNEAAGLFKHVYSRRRSEFTDLDGYAAALYYSFWTAESGDADCILMEAVDPHEAPGLSDRMRRASEAVYRPGLIGEYLQATQGPGTR